MPHPAHPKAHPPSGHGPLPKRSDKWLSGADEVAMLHRAALRSAGVTVSKEGGRPVIGIAQSASDLNPCNLPLGELAKDVAAGVSEGGGEPVIFPTMSLGEDLMKPSAMLYRNLLAIEIEENLRSYPLDGVVLLVNCDKTGPGALMGAISANLPCLVFSAGARRAATFRGQQFGSGTDLWKALQERTTGEVSDQAWDELEESLSCDLGACNTMGTASSMAVIIEALGFMLPGSSTIPAYDVRRRDVALATGRRAVELVTEDLRPSEILSDASLQNAVRVLHALGGSTNAALHLLAIAGRSRHPLTLSEIDRLGRDTPVIADVKPSGRRLVHDLDRDGGCPAIIWALREQLHLHALTVTGRRWRDEMRPGRSDQGAERSTILSPEAAISDHGALAVVYGNLAPRGAVLKVTAASPHLFKHRGPAVVFRGYAEMRERIVDPDLEVTPESVLVMSGAGPVGGVGMPEWGMIPVPPKLAAQGVTDMVRVTDARMSGTSYGTCFVHVSPEAAVGGVLGLVEDGDVIEVDVHARTLQLDVDPETLQTRRRRRPVSGASQVRGWPALYQSTVMQADQGCDLGFLRFASGDESLWEPVVGRS